MMTENDFITIGTNDKLYNSADQQTNNYVIGRGDEVA